LEEIQAQAEMLATNCEAYAVMYERAREAYLSFVNFAPSVQLKMNDVEKWHDQFEVKRQEAMDDFEEMERLKTWYEYF
jgi:hypothetical protein